MWSGGGNPLPFGDQETVGCDAQCAVMMESPPAAALIMAEADFLVAVIVSVRQRILARSTSRRSDMSGSTVASQCLVGLASSLGHSMSRVSSAKRAAPPIGEIRTRTSAKRDRSFLLVPSRHATVRQARLSSLRANASTLSRGGFGISWLKRLETRSSRGDNSPRKATDRPLIAAPGPSLARPRMALSLKTANALGLDAPRARR